MNAREITQLRRSAAGKVLISSLDARSQKKVGCAVFGSGRMCSIDQPHPQKGIHLPLLDSELIPCGVAGGAFRFSNLKSLYLDTIEVDRGIRVCSGKHLLQMTSIPKEMKSPSSWRELHIIPKRV